MDEFRLLNRSASGRLDVLKSNSVLKVASLKSLKELAESVRPLRLRRGAVLWHEGDRADSAACLIRGHLLVQKTDPLGRIVYYHVRKPGDFLAHPALAASPESLPATYTHQVTLVARDEAVLLRIAHPSLQALLAREPLLFHQLVRDVSESLRLCMDDLFAQRVYKGKVLLASKLLALAETEERTEADRAHLRYSQLELSRFTALGTRNINTFLRDLPAVRTVSGRKGVLIESLKTLRDFLRTAGNTDTDSAE
jgi:CRP-like cAMP-binding protein